MSPSSPRSRRATSRSSGPPRAGTPPPDDGAGRRRPPTATADSAPRRAHPSDDGVDADDRRWARQRAGSAQRHDGAFGVASSSVASEGWTALAGATLESVFSADYAATAIERFLKHLDTPSVALRLGDDRRLVLFHELAPSSHVSFVVAPRDVD